MFPVYQFEKGIDSRVTKHTIRESAQYSIVIPTLKGSMNNKDRIILHITETGANKIAHEINAQVLESSYSLVGRKLVLMLGMDEQIAEQYESASAAGDWEMVQEIEDYVIHTELSHIKTAADITQLIDDLINLPLTTSVRDSELGNVFASSQHAEYFVADCLEVLAKEYGLDARVSQMIAIYRNENGLYHNNSVTKYIFQTLGELPQDSPLHQLLSIEVEFGGLAGYANAWVNHEVNVALDQLSKANLLAAPNQLLDLLGSGLSEVGENDVEISYIDESHEEEETQPLATKPTLLHLLAVVDPQSRSAVMDKIANFWTGNQSKDSDTLKAGFDQYQTGG
jgi:hypothetical protein